MIYIIFLGNGLNIEWQAVKAPAVLPAANPEVPQGNYLTDAAILDPDDQRISLYSNTVDISV